MLIYDITREVFEAPVYPGDPKPTKRFLKSIGDDSTYNLSAVNLCTHTGTHIDAPLHFDEEGADIGSMKPPHCNKRLIFHGSGKAFLSVSAARVIADSKLRLVGTDAMSIAPPFDEMMPHLELARAGIAVLEGLFLEGVEDGEYTLSALPLKMKGLEASPCRAVLMREPKGY